MKRETPLQQQNLVILLGNFIFELVKLNAYEVPCKKEKLYFFTKNALYE